MASVPNSGIGGTTLADTIGPGLRATITIAVIAATLMEVLDTSIVNVALPDMMGNLGATLDEIGWVATGYIISNVIVLPLTGWLSDFFGRKRYLTYSIILFTLASLFCGTTRSLSGLIFWRVVQGAGGAAFLSTSQATLMEVYKPAQRGFAQALFGIGVIMAPTIGPTLGGYITDRYTWPWIFFVNIPIGIIAGILTYTFVPDSPSAASRRRVDAIGILLLAIGLGSMQTMLERGESQNWFETNYIVVLAFAAALGLAAFIWWELRPANLNPAINLRIVKNRNLAAGTIYAFALGFVLYGGVFVLPQFLQSVQTYSAMQSGLILLPGGLASAAMMPVVGQLSNRVDNRLLIMVGMLVFIWSMLTFTIRLTPDMTANYMVMPLILRGAGIGLQFVPLSLVTLGTLNPAQLAEGAGIYNLFRQLGGSFGIAMLTTVIDRREHFHFQRLSENITPYNLALHERLTAYQGAMVANGQSAASAQTQSYQMLGHVMTQQSLVMTYIDVFHEMAYVGMGTLVLLFLFQRARRISPAAAAAH